MPGFIGLPELMLLGIVVLLVFGPKRLPEMGRSLGRGLREFKQSVTGNDPAPDALDFSELTRADAATTTPVAATGPAAVADATPVVAVPSQNQNQRVS